MKELLSIFRALLRTVATMAAAVLVLFGALAVVYFPYATDDPNEEPPPLEVAESDEFYEEVYAGVAQDAAPEAAADHVYVEMGRGAGESLGITEVVGRFVERNDLQGASVLEVGAGSGTLQDLVEDYTGLDIAASAARYFHKPFVHGSATDLPFEDDTFDVIWTVWTLEHVPNPERALQEMRRVVKPGGLLLLVPAWNNTSWAADGYDVRPYSDFDLGGKLIKASLALRGNKLYQYAYLVSARTVRRTLWSLSGEGPSAFHYRRLTPNYDHYWQEDSDAINSLDPHEMMLWHLSRGDQCLNCPADASGQIQIGNQPLEIRVRKAPASSVARVP
jgi:SAM-dependent methyltransferase